MAKEKIRVLKIAPLRYPCEHYLAPSMKAFREAVDADNLEFGGVEAKKLERNVYAIFNKDRFLAYLKGNRRIGSDIIAGNMYIVGVDDNKFPISLTEEQSLKYTLKFWDIEEFDEIDVMEANLDTLFSRFLADEE